MLKALQIVNFVPGNKFIIHKNINTMKKITFTLLLTFAVFSLFAQIDRELVLVEMGTGTGCPYCPAAATGLHDLYANGDPVAGVEYHSYN